MNNSLKVSTNIQLAYRLNEMMSEKTSDKSTQIPTPDNQKDQSAKQILDKVKPINASKSIIEISDRTTKIIRPLIVLPGIESRLTDFSRVSDVLNGQIWGVNYSSDAEIDTIEKESQFCLQVCFCLFLFCNFTPGTNGSSLLNDVRTG